MSEEELLGPEEKGRGETTENATSGLHILESLQAELEEANRERSQFKSLAQRAQADLMNLRKRAEEEREALYYATAARLITKLLPIVDDLQLALDRVPAEAQEAAWLDGIRIIERNLRSLLESEGVTTIEAKGKSFDPWEHEALFAVEDAEKAEGTVVTVIRAGYKLHGKVLRSAQVAVSQRAKDKEQGHAGSSSGAPDQQEKEA